METINHECYVSLEVAKLLKEAGFDWEADTYYQHGILRDGWCSNKNKENLITCSAPTLAVAQKWLREEKNISVDVLHQHNGWVFGITDLSNNSLLTVKLIVSSTYEEALEAGIKKRLTNLLEKKQ